MGKPHRVVALVLKEVKQMWRDRSAIALVFLMPLALAGITTLAFGPLGNGVAAKIGVVNQDHGQMSNILVDQVLPGFQGKNGSPAITVVNYASTDLARAAAKKGKVAAAIIIPPGLTSAVRANKPSKLLLLTGSDDGIGVPVATAILQGFSAQVGSNELSVIVATHGPGAAHRTAALVAAATAERNPVVLDNTFGTGGKLGAGSYFAPSMMIIALFFCGVVLARGFVSERRKRTLARVLVAGTRPSSLLWAKFIVAFVTGLLSSCIVLALFAAFGANFGNLAVLGALVLVTTLAMISTASLSVLLARDEDQAGTLGTVVVFVLAILGGNFVPLAQSGGALSVLALFTPNGWAIRGFANLAVTAHDPLAAVMPQLLVLLGFAVVTGGAALALSRRVVEAAGV